MKGRRSLSKPQLLQSIAIVSTLLLTLAGCATESHRALKPETYNAPQKLDQY